MKNFDYYRPENDRQAAELAGKIKNASFKAGGTDLLPMMKDGLREPDAVVNLSQIKAMHGIKVDAEAAWIGAATTLGDLAEHSGLQKQASAITDAAGKTATPLVRNKATVGGNLCQRPRCWYFRHPEYQCSKKGGDTCYTMEGENKYHAIFENTTCNIVHPSNLAPALWAHDAKLHIKPPTGDQKTTSIADFWILPEEDMSTEIALNKGELLTGVHVPLSKKGQGSAYIEVREKDSYDWAMVATAARIDLDGKKVKDLRIIAAAVAPVPLRMEEAEKVLRGKTFTEELAWKAGTAATADATPLRDNGYKVRMLRACVAHALIKAHTRAERS